MRKPIVLVSFEFNIYIYYRFSQFYFHHSIYQLLTIFIAIAIFFCKMFFSLYVLRCGLIECRIVLFMKTKNNVK